MDNSKNIDQLNDLLEKNYDAVAGYKKAKETISSSTLDNFFDKQISTRKALEQDLKEVITTMGGTPKESGSITGTLHRGWIDFKSFIGSNDESAIIEECIRGEKASVKEYEDVLDGFSSDKGGLKLKIMNHVNIIKAALVSLEVREDAQS